MHCGRILVQMSKVQYQWHINLHVQFIKKPCIRLYWQCCKRIYALQAGRKDRSNSSDVISLNLQGAPTLPWTSSVSDSTESRRRREVKWGWSSEMIWDLTIWFAKFFFQDLRDLENMAIQAGQKKFLDTKQATGREDLQVDVSQQSWRPAWWAEATLWMRQENKRMLTGPWLYAVIIVIFRWSFKFVTRLDKTYFCPPQHLTMIV